MSPAALYNWGETMNRLLSVVVTIALLVAGTTAMAESAVYPEIIIGQYEQDGIAENGAEPIEWLIVEETQDAMLCVSKYAIDNIAYVHLFKQASHGPLFIRAIPRAPAILNCDGHAGVIRKGEAVILIDQLPQGMNPYARVHFLDDVVAVVTQGVHIVPRHKCRAVRQRAPLFSGFTLRHPAFKLPDLVSRHTAANDGHGNSRVDAALAEQSDIRSSPSTSVTVACMVLE